MNNSINIPRPVLLPNELVLKLTPVRKCNLLSSFDENRVNTQERSVFEFYKDKLKPSLKNSKNHQTYSSFANHQYCLVYLTTLRLIIIPFTQSINGFNLSYSFALPIKQIERCHVEKNDFEKSNYTNKDYYTVLIKFHLVGNDYNLESSFLRIQSKSKTRIIDIASLISAIRYAYSVGEELKESCEKSRTSEYDYSRITGFESGYELFFHLLDPRLQNQGTDNFVAVDMDLAQEFSNDYLPTYEESEKAVGNFFKKSGLLNSIVIRDIQYLQNLQNSNSIIPQPGANFDYYYQHNMNEEFRPFLFINRHTSDDDYGNYYYKFLAENALRYSERNVDDIIQVIYDNLHRNFNTVPESEVENTLVVQNNETLAEREVLEEADCSAAYGVSDTQSKVVESTSLANCSNNLDNASASSATNNVTHSTTNTDEGETITPSTSMLEDEGVGGAAGKEPLCVVPIHQELSAASPVMPIRMNSVSDKHHSLNTIVLRQRESLRNSERISYASHVSGGNRSSKISGVSDDFLTPEGYSRLSQFITQDFMVQGGSARPDEYISQRNTASLINNNDINININSTNIDVAFEDSAAYDDDVASYLEVITIQSDIENETNDLLSDSNYFKTSKLVDEKIKHERLETRSMLMDFDGGAESSAVSVFSSEIDNVSVMEVHLRADSDFGAGNHMPEPLEDADTGIAKLVPVTRKSMDMSLRVVVPNQDFLLNNNRFLETATEHSTSNYLSSAAANTAAENLKTPKSPSSIYYPNTGFSLFKKQEYNLQKKKSLINAEKGKSRVDMLKSKHKRASSLNLKQFFENFNQKEGDTHAEHYGKEAISRSNSPSVSRKSSMSLLKDKVQQNSGKKMHKILGSISRRSESVSFSQPFSPSFFPSSREPAGKKDRNKASFNSQLVENKYDISFRGAPLANGNTLISEQFSSLSNSRNKTKHKRSSSNLLLNRSFSKSTSNIKSNQEVPFYYNPENPYSDIINNRNKFNPLNNDKAPAQKKHGHSRKKSVLNLKLNLSNSNK